MTTEFNKYLPNNPEIRTTKQLVHDLIDAMTANPNFADQPIGFSLDGETAYFVRGYDECTATGGIVLTKG
jgi:hypothetical protein